jgi:NADH-quinone oxidoreductase subunit G
MEMGASRTDRHGTPFDRWYNESHKIDCQPGWQTLPAIAEKLGHAMTYKGPKQIMQEITETNPAFDGATNQQMDLQGVRLQEIGEPA